MTVTILPVALACLLVVPDPCASGKNPIAAQLRGEGWAVAETRVVFPGPRFFAGQSVANERAVLSALAGSDRAVSELTRNSVSAPFVLKTTDVSVRGGVVRRADLWFVVHAELSGLDPSRSSSGIPEEQTTEAGNMKFSVRRLKLGELAPAVKEGRPEGQAREHEWFIHGEGRLLDRIHVEATDRILATETNGGWEIASLTDRRFDASEHAPNRWSRLTRQGATEREGRPESYPGGAGVVSIQRLQSVPGALMVEAHFAFFEPRAWFDGAAILRSKIGLITQDRVRALRRELAKSRPVAPARSTGTCGPSGD